MATELMIKKIAQVMHITLTIKMFMPQMLMQRMLMREAMRTGIRLRYAELGGIGLRGHQHNGNETDISRSTSRIGTGVRYAPRRQEFMIRVDRVAQHLQN